MLDYRLYHHSWLWPLFPSPPLQFYPFSRISLELHTMSWFMLDFTKCIFIQWNYTVPSSSCLNHFVQHNWFENSLILLCHYCFFLLLSGISLYGHTTICSIRHHLVPFWDAKGLHLHGSSLCCARPLLGLSPRLSISFRVGLPVVIYILQHMEDLSAVFWLLVFLP